MMLRDSHNLLSLLLILAFSRISAVEVAGGSSGPLKSRSAAGRSSSTRTRSNRSINHSRRLQKDDKEVDNEKQNNDKNNDKNNKDETVSPTVRPTQVPTAKPTLVPTEPPTPGPTEPPTPAPTNPPQPVVDESQPAATTSDEQVTLSMEDLRDIQYMGDGIITLDLSLWFQDGRVARDVAGGAMRTAVLHSVQSLLCQLEEDSGAGDDGKPLEAILAATDSAVVEEVELCVIKTGLSATATDLFLRQGQTSMEGSVLLQPPTTRVVDRSSSGVQNEQLQWTTWRLTFSVLRLGTFYILQGLENAAPLDNDGDRQNDAADAQNVIAGMTHEEIYAAGVTAMQQVLNLALQVSIRDNDYDQMLSQSMAQMGVNDDNPLEGLVLASIYGEEEASLAPKLQVLGFVSSNSEPADTTQPRETSPPLKPTHTIDTDVGGNTADIVVSNQVVEETEGDALYDDDRYSLEYGITETLDPPFWHTLRIVGMFMFVMTFAALIGLSCMSKKRQARRELERKMAKEGMGLLNNNQGVEDMLRASGRQPGGPGKVVNDSD